MNEHNKERLVEKNNWNNKVNNGEYLRSFSEYTLFYELERGATTPIIDFVVH